MSHHSKEQYPDHNTIEIHADQVRAVIEILAGTDKEDLYFYGNGILGRIGKNNTFYVINGAWKGTINKEMDKIKINEEWEDINIIWSSYELPLTANADRDYGYNEQITEIERLTTPEKTDE